MDGWKVICVLSLTVLASGCVDGDSGGGITVTELSIEPQQIRAGSDVSVTMNVRNNGFLEGTVVTDSDRMDNIRDRQTGLDGDQILTNSCPDYFSIEEFRASSSTTSETQSSYLIDQGERLRLYWRLKQGNPEDVPLEGYPCPLRFEVPFDYSVNAYKQIQFKRDREVQGSTNLQQKSSQGPLEVQMELVGSTADQPATVLEQDQASVFVTVANRDQSESPYTGLIEIDSLDISGSENIDIDGSCGDAESVTLADGRQEIYECSISPSSSVMEDGGLSSPSVRGEVNVNVDYTFVKEVGSRTVKVEYNGD